MDKSHVVWEPVNTFPVNWLGPIRVVSKLGDLHHGGLGPARYLLVTEEALLHGGHGSLRATGYVPVAKLALYAHTALRGRPSVDGVRKCHWLRWSVSQPEGRIGEPGDHQDRQHEAHNGEAEKANKPEGYDFCVHSRRFPSRFSLARLGLVTSKMLVCDNFGSQKETGLKEQPVINVINVKRVGDYQHHQYHGGGQHDQGKEGQRYPKALGTWR